MQTMTRQPDKPAESPGQARQAPPKLDSRVLFRGGRRLIIEHDGSEYLLRITQRGKLILTK